MNEFKGTKGEWLIELNSDQPHHITNEEGTRAIAFVPYLHPQAIENIKLISAAPELLEARQEALKELRYHNWSNTKTGFLLGHAINKALGL